MLQAQENCKVHASVCHNYDEKHFSLNSSHNNSSVDNIPSNCSVQKFYQQIGLDMDTLLFSLWTRLTNKVCVYSTNAKPVANCIFVVEI